MGLGLKEIKTESTQNYYRIVAPVPPLLDPRTVRAGKEAGASANMRGQGARGAGWAPLPCACKQSTSSLVRHRTLHALHLDLMLHIN